MIHINKIDIQYLDGYYFFFLSNFIGVYLQASQQILEILHFTIQRNSYILLQQAFSLQFIGLGIQAPVMQSIINTNSFLHLLILHLTKCVKTRYQTLCLFFIYILGHIGSQKHKMQLDKCQGRVTQKVHGISELGVQEGSVQFKSSLDLAKLSN